MNEDSDDSGEDTQNSRAVFKYDEALDTFMGEKEVLAEVLAEFRERVKGQMTIMKNLLVNKKWEDLTREAHSIKGGGWNLAMERLGDAAALLEKSAKENKADESEKLINDVEKEFNQLLKHFKNNNI